MLLLKMGGKMEGRKEEMMGNRITPISIRQAHTIMYITYHNSNKLQWLFRAGQTRTQSCTYIRILHSIFTLSSLYCMLYFQLFTDFQNVHTETKCFINIFLFRHVENSEQPALAPGFWMIGDEEAWSIWGLQRSTIDRCHINNPHYFLSYRS